MPKHTTDDPVKRIQSICDSMEKSKPLTEDFMWFSQWLADFEQLKKEFACNE